MPLSDARGVAEPAKIRTRFGLRLNWPIRNAGTFVTYLTEKQFVAATNALGVFKNQIGSLANSTLRTELVDRLFIEQG